MKGVNELNYISVPGTGTKLFDGTVVALAKYPGTKWIVRQGWFSYQGQQRNGWYFCSISTQTTIPVSNEDLLTVTVISSDGCGCCPPTPCPPTPFPPGPLGPPGPPPICNPFSNKDKFQVDRSFISVDTIAERDYLLQNQLIPDGKIVKVNQTKQGKMYFTWNQVISQWEEETFGPNTLAGQTDVNIATPADGQSLVYDATSKKWINKKLAKADVGLGNVDNTADSNKVVKSAGTLTNARNITLAGDATGSASFDGSKDVTIEVTGVKAAADGEGNNIVATYATKEEAAAAILTWQSI